MDAIVVNAHNLNLFKCRSTVLLAVDVDGRHMVQSKQCMKIARLGFDKMIKVDFFGEQELLTTTTSAGVSVDAYTRIY